MVILGQRWAEDYMKKNPGITIQVTGGGSGTGIAALINGTTDICESSRPMKDAEKADVQAKRGAPAVETKVALDALAVYVNEKSPLQEISIPALRKIYLGETTNWKDVGGPSHAIVLYGRENNSGTYGYFKEHVLENKDFAAGDADARRHVRRRQRRQGGRLRHRVRRDRVPRGHPRAQGEEGRRLAGHRAVARDGAERDVPHQPLSLLLHGGRADRHGQEVHRLDREPRRARRSSATSATTPCPKS